MAGLEIQHHDASAATGRGKTGLLVWQVDAHVVERVLYRDAVLEGIGANRLVGLEVELNQLGRDRRVSMRVLSISST